MGILTRGSVRRRGSSALVGGIDVEDLDPACGPVVDEEVMRGAELDEDRSWTGWLERGLVLGQHVIAGGSGCWCRW